MKITITLVHIFKYNCMKICTEVSNNSFTTVSEIIPYNKCNTQQEAPNMGRRPYIAFIRVFFQNDLLTLVTVMYNSYIYIYITVSDLRKFSLIKARNI